MQQQCSPAVKEKALPCLEDSHSLTVCPPQNALHAPLAHLQLCWKVGLDWAVNQLIRQTNPVLRWNRQAN